MHKLILLFTILVVSNNSNAEFMNCNMGENAIFTMISLDTQSKSAVITDRYGKNIDGKIILIRKMENEKNKFNISLAYKINKVVNHIDLIIIPIDGDTYKVGMAGYVEKDKKKILDIAVNDEAMCF